MQLTAKELIEQLKLVPEDSVVRFQHIEDKYINGSNIESIWDGKEKISSSSHGWVTYDIPCGVYFHPAQCSKVKTGESCINCEDRNRYITASQCFIYKGELFIDGHY